MHPTKIWKGIQKIFKIIRDFIQPSCFYFRNGWQKGLLGKYVRAYLKHMAQAIRFMNFFLIKEYQSVGGLQEGQMQRLQRTVGGLHQLLPRDSRFSYSLLMPLLSLHPDHFMASVESALSQSAPCFELLLGTAEPLSPEIQAWIESCQAKYPNRLRLVALKETLFCQAVNQLALEAKGFFLFLLRSDAWIRPDFLYRCEQYLRFFPDLIEHACLYTDEAEISGWDDPIPGTRVKKEPFKTPYLFRNIVGQTLLTPRHLWLRSGGIPADLESEDAEWGLALRLDLAGAHFFHLPFPLYAHRSHVCKQSKEELLLAELSAYSAAKGLKWSWSLGDIDKTFRAIPVDTPSSTQTPLIHAIMPFKEQKALTLKTIDSLMRQQNVRLCITAVDNGSADSSIGQEIEARGGEVLRIEEPFNYSRLNNLAVEKSSFSAAADWLLFINNDVELKEDALLEMSRWISQPGIGVVGCRLSYPNGLLQHGGVAIERIFSPHLVGWVHREAHRPLEKQRESRILGVVEAVTAACILMQRKIFFEVGGFDEVWYPIAHSDTNLAVKLKKRGLLSFYTPYATGIHHESISRARENLEDVESSEWMGACHAAYALIPKS